jgi:Gram-negative bacterial TonB protein C-terminal
MTQNNPLPLVAGTNPAGASPQLPVPVGALQKPVLQARAGSSGPATQDAQNIVNNVNASANSGGNSLLSISVDPSADASKIAVPPGNRYGEFSIAPASTPGSPGGNPKTTEIGGGPGSTSGPGGEGSMGVGTGGPGGGGGPASVSVGPISVKGTMTATESPLVLIGSVPAEMVYPLPLDVIAKLRKNRMVISAGSLGGGGLDVYGALACGKIYTIFLPMPGANWTMQFCEKSAAAASDKPAPQAKVVQVDPQLVPPDPDSDARFDFKRLPVPPEKGHKMIVLKGVLGEDGTVANLEVYQGVLAEMDQAAQLAFSRWKFKPAMRADKPVSVEILVGIPTQIPAVSTSGPPQQQR